ncbi:efflux RND transporter periplasmic adaptor subunit [Salinibacter altiplanensis]|uniref:efflux RND transporter periplasmic adaptor subunit n=1 Tax=Salinibacter altiplanensis TaxID=1803181 RepID=UPI001319E2B6|nr:efflux RND transporter periplasmic adaptor subunit [Salinibacter altiplanensis]
MRASRFVSLWVSLLVGLAALLAGCGDEETTKAATAQDRTRTRVEALVLQPQSFEDVVEVTGSVEALDDARLSAEAAGTLVHVAERGTRVPADSLVARVNPRSARAAVEQARAQVESAQAQYELAQDTYDRQAPLYRDSIISASEFESVRSQRTQAFASLNQAEANLSQAQEQLASTRIDAPFSGIVEEQLQEPGEQASPGQEVVRLVDTRQVRVEAGVPERYANDLVQGDSVRVRIQSAPLDDRWGRLAFVGNTIDPASRTFPIEVKIANPERRLKPEMVATVFVVRERLDDVLVAPRSAISRDEGGLDAYTVARTDSGAVVQSRPVTLGPASGNRVVVRSGLSPGDELITVGQSDVATGDRVEVVERHDDVDTADPAADAAQNAAPDAPMSPADSNAP